MIVVKKNRLRWSKSDVMTMARILGADDAVRRQSPLVPSILKLAQKYRVPLSRRAEALLADAIELRDWAKQVRAQSEHAYPTNGKLFPHQVSDLQYMQTLNLPAYLLAHDVGGGKTLEAIRHARQHTGNRILVITTNSAKDQWAEALRHWEDLDATIVHGKIVQQIEQLARHRKGWIIGHWESLVHARAGYLQRPWSTIILDEAHWMQNRKAQRSDTVFALQAARRLALTADPWSKSPDQMFAILRFLYPELYPGFWRFFHMHVAAMPKPHGGYEVEGVRRPKLLKWEIAPFTLRRTKQEMFASLPRIVRVQRKAELTEKGRREYTRIRKEFFAELEQHDGSAKFIAIPSVLARLTRLRQYLVDPGLLGAREPSVKYPIVHELLQEIGQPTVIFTEFAQASIRLAQYLAKRKLRVARMAGDVTARDRKSAKRKFLKGKLDALIIVTKLGGESLNLGGYGYLIFLDLPWTKRALTQAEGRVDRPEENTGRLVPTTAYRVIVKSSYEERIEEKVEQTFQHFKQVFTVGDLRRLFE